MRINKFVALLAGTSMAALAAASPAFAQDADDDDEEIVVTGSQIRGIAPAGANVIGLNADDIEETGASGGTDILASIPQIQNFFNAMPDVGGNNPFGITAAPIARPNLRSLPGANVNSGSLTLVMMDGHRVTPAGLSQLAVDPDMVPPALLQRVEIMPDGASALYGSDAVGGVINFITRTEFDGVEGSARYGFADDYNAWDANLTVGRSWGRGSVFASYTHAEHDPLFGIDRDYIQSIEYTPASPFFGRGLERACAPGNLSAQVGTDATTNTFMLNSSGVPIAGPEARCDTTDFQTFYSEDTRDSLLLGFSQELTESLRLDIRGFITDRESVTYGGPTRVNLTGANAITSANVPLAAYYTAANNALTAINATLANRPHVLRFSLENQTGLPERANLLTTWQFAPILTWDVGGDWQVRALATYGESETESRSASVITALINSRVAAGTINPYNLAASAPGAFDGLYGTSRTIGNVEFQNYRVVADGPLLTLPGGKVSLAAGAEYMDTAFERRTTGVAPTFTLGAPVPYDQTVGSVFGELQVPIIGEGNRLPFVQSLLFSASIRRDDYNDVGETTNPSLGLTYEPLDWITLRGIWGESFVAPSGAALTGLNTGGLLIAGPFPTAGGAGFVTVPVGSPAPVNGDIGLVLNMGTAAGLEPQTSENWSMGLEIRPPWIEGLTLSATYYAIDMQNILQNPLSSGIEQVIANFPTAVTYNGGNAIDPGAITALINQASAASRQNYIDNFAGNRVVILIDNQLTNIGGAWVEGLDFAANYTYDLSFGTLDASISGNHEVINTTQDSPGPVADRLEPGGDIPRWRWAAGVGMTVDNFRARVTWNHSAGYDVQPALNFGQTEVDAFDTVDTFFSYEVGGEGLLEDLRLSLNVNNIFDEDPPVLTRTGFQNFGYANTAFTLGRFIQFGINKRF